MNASNYVVNDAFVSVAENMKAKDAIVRLVLSAVLIGALLTVQPVQYLGSIVPVLAYLFTTAITRWDPLYSLIGLQWEDGKTSKPVGLSEGSVSAGINPHASTPVANDTHGTDDHLKNTG